MPQCYLVFTGCLDKKTIQTRLVPSLTELHLVLPSFTEFFGGRHSWKLRVRYLVFIYRVFGSEGDTQAMPAPKIKEERILIGSRLEQEKKKKKKKKNKKK